MIGYNPGIDFSFIEENRRLRKRHPELVAEVIQKITALGAHAVWNKETELLDVNHEMSVSIVLCRHTETGAGSSRWLIRLDASARPDITVAVRMDATNEGIRDYYVLPAIDMTWENLRVAEVNRTSEPGLGANECVPAGKWCESTSFRQFCRRSPSAL
jgi:hypothetical protein